MSGLKTGVKPGQVATEKQTHGRRAGTGAALRLGGAGGCGEKVQGQRQYLGEAACGFPSLRALWGWGGGQSICSRIEGGVARERVGV